MPYPSRRVTVRLHLDQLGRALDLRPDVAILRAAPHDFEPYLILAIADPTADEVPEGTEARTVPLEKVQADRYE